MKRTLAALILAALAPLAPAEDLPEIPALVETDKALVEEGLVAGIITRVGDAEKILHQDVQGLAELPTDGKEGRPMTEDAMFWIASMTKPVTGTALAMAAERGLVTITDPVAKYLPEFQDLKDEAGNPVVITVENCLSHTTGLPELTPQEEVAISNLDELCSAVVKKRVKFAPGSKWAYCQTGMGVAARVLEVVTGDTYVEFLQKNLFDPLGMKDTTFYPTDAQMKRMAVSYEKPEGGEFKEAPPYFLFGKSPTDTTRYPRASGGLFSTAADYGKFLRMILRGGELDGHRYLKPETIREMTRSHTSGLQNVGFVPGSAYGLGWINVMEPSGAAAALSPGSYGHGGAYVTQAWIDPVKGRYTLMLIQRAKYNNGDKSDLRRRFQEAAAK